MGRFWVFSAFVVAVALLAIGAALAVNNPTVQGSTEGDYTCFAPYDIVLFGGENNVGDHTDYFATLCRDAAEERFAWASVFLGLGLVVGGAGAFLALRRRRSGRVQDAAAGGTARDTPTVLDVGA